MKYHLHRIITDKKISLNPLVRCSGYYIQCRDYLNLKRKEILYIDNNGYMWKIIVPYLIERYYPNVSETKFYKCEVSYG